MVGHDMNDKPSAVIIPFPHTQHACPSGAPQRKDGSADRLPRALAALEAALSHQREAVAQWQASLGELRDSMATLSGSADRYQHSLTQLGTQAAELAHANRALQRTRNDAP
jgi:septal ring factor EnvC (AmiA/AmiB activator)